MILITPRLLLVNSKNRYVLEHQCNAGSFVTVEDESVTDLGPTLKAKVISITPKAVFFSDGTPEVVSVNPTSHEFQSIVDAAQSTTDPWSRNCQYGVEALLELGRTQASFFMGSKSLRRASVQLKSTEGHDVLLTTELMVAKQFSWYTFSVWVKSTDVIKLNPITCYSEEDFDDGFRE